MNKRQRKKHFKKIVAKRIYLKSLDDEIAKMPIRDILPERRGFTSSLRSK